MNYFREYVNRDIQLKAKAANCARFPGTWNSLKSSNIFFRFFFSILFPLHHRSGATS